MPNSLRNYKNETDSQARDHFCKTMFILPDTTLRLREIIENAFWGGFEGWLGGLGGLGVLRGLRGGTECHPIAYFLRRFNNKP